MIAIRISGRRTPPIVKAKTSLGLGHGTVVDIRTFMYEVRKQVKMKVSLSRNIHIIALPQGTWNACLSADQSETTLARPASAEVDTSPERCCGSDISVSVVLSASSAIRVCSGSLSGQQHSEEDQPHQ